MSYISAETAAVLEAHAERRSIAFRMMSTPPLHVWSGIGTIVAPMRSVSLSGETYLGGGQFQGLPEFSQLINGKAERIEFTMSGVKQAELPRTLFDDDEAIVRNAPVHIGVLVFDAQWQPASEIIPLARCVADFTALKRAPVQRDAAPVYDLMLSCHYGEVDRSRGKEIHWTPPHQHRRNANDSACDHVYRYQQGVQVTWPRG